MTQRFTRQQLYDLVWSEPKSRLSKRLGISDVGLSKVCKKANIPTPGLGYWAKLDSGKNVIRPPLPPRAFGSHDMVSFTGLSGVEGEETTTQEEPDEELLLEDMAVIEQKVRAMVGKVGQPRNTSNPHRLIARMLEKDEERRKKLETERFPSIFDGPLFNSSHERRRLRFLNALALTLAKHDCSLSLNGNEGREGSAHIGDQHVSFKLDFTGPLYGKERRYSNRAQEKGPFKLRLQMEKSWTKGPPITWDDKDDASLENQITEIVVSLIVAGEQQMRDGIAWRKEADRQFAIHLVEQKKAEEEAAEKERIEALLAGAAAWRQACDIRGFVTAMRGTDESDNVTVDGKPLNEWCEWALSQADKIDPTVSQEGNEQGAAD